MNMKFSKLNLEEILLKRLRNLVCDDKYIWEGSRIILIPKPGNKSKRPFSIPGSSDNIVQEVIRSYNNYFRTYL
jgi:retron-type reverse transcriptase